MAENTGLVEDIIVGLTINEQGRPIEIERQSLKWNLSSEEFDIISEDVKAPELDIEQVNAAAFPAGIMAAGAATGVETGLSVAKFAWDVIKDNRPITSAEGAFTYVLSRVNSDPLAYS
ncbi:MAG: hypothetical protein ACE5Q6_04685 [Dehalococcoidia bacterium]